MRLRLRPLLVALAAVPAWFAAAALSVLVHEAAHAIGAGVLPHLANGPFPSDPTPGTIWLDSGGILRAYAGLTLFDAHPACLGMAWTGAPPTLWSDLLPAFAAGGVSLIAGLGARRWPHPPCRAAAAAVGFGGYATVGHLQASGVTLVGAVAVAASVQVMAIGPWALRPPSRRPSGPLVRFGGPGAPGQRGSHNPALPGQAAQVMRDQLL